MSIELVSALVSEVRDTCKVRNVPTGATWVQCLGHTNTQHTSSESQSIYEARRA